MSLLRLDIHHLRNLQHVSINPAPHLNLLIGPNGSGKTSLLEAIYLLSYARSFRTARSIDLITHGAQTLTISGQFNSHGRQRRLGIGFEGNRRELRSDGRVITARTELLQTLPVRLIDPTVHDLFEASPRSRRRFLDWGVFYSEPQYLSAWRNYQRALGHRNAALKAKDRQGAQLWGQEAAKYGKILSRCRQDYLQQLQSGFSETTCQWLEDNLELRYLPGWGRDKDLQTALSDDLEKDLRNGCTHSGPHRDDFMVYAGERPVRKCFSRGQMKVLVYALALVQSRLVDRPCCLLFDDLGSELDFENQALLTDLIVHSKEQIFITATRSDTLITLLPYVGRSFQVNQGSIVPTDSKPHSE